MQETERVTRHKNPRSARWESMHMFLPPLPMIISVCKTVKACQGLCLQQFVSRVTSWLASFQRISHSVAVQALAGNCQWGLCTASLFHSLVPLGGGNRANRSSLSFSFSNLTKARRLALARNNMSQRVRKNLWYRPADIMTVFITFSTLHLMLLGYVRYGFYSAHCDNSSTQA